MWQLFVKEVSCSKCKIQKGKQTLCVSCHATITQGPELFHIVSPPHFLPAMGSSLCFLHANLTSKQSLLRFSAYMLQICSKSTCLLPLLLEALSLPEATKFLDFASAIALLCKSLCCAGLLCSSDLLAATQPACVLESCLARGLKALSLSCQ